MEHSTIKQKISLAVDDLLIIIDLIVLRILRGIIIVQAN